MKSRSSGHIRLGCAGWSLPKEWADRLGQVGSHLERYASRFNAVEINSTFYKLHRQATFLKWAQSVPDDFTFSVKIPKEITHQKKLRDATNELAQFLSIVDSLGSKLKVFLVQLPPALEYDPDSTKKFFETFRERSSGGIACEPRHRSWFNDRVDKVLAGFHVARVAADPAVVPEAIEPGGWDHLRYYRLHGSPRKYYSSYDLGYLTTLSKRLEAEAKAKDVWCIFDNTASGAAVENADAVRQQIRQK